MAGRAGDDAPQGLEGFAHETLRGQTAVLLKARDVLHPHVVLTGEHMTFAVGDPEDSLAAARRFLAEQVRSGRCALSYEAQLPGESTRTLIVEAHEVGLPHSVRFGRRFRRTRLTRRCRLIGEPFEMEPGAPLLVDPAVADAPSNGDEIQFPR